jgi:hypothetical protein
MSNLGKFIIKNLNKNIIKEKKSLSEKSLVTLITKMGMIDDQDSIFEMFQYIESQDIDITFDFGDTLYRRYISVKNIYKNKDKIVDIMKRSDKRKNVFIDDEWLKKNKEKEIED